MARFSRGLFRELANPSYGQGLMAVGAQLGSAQAEAQAAERQKEIDSMSFKLLRQGLFSADQGDVSALAARTNDLVDMMNRTTDEKSRATLQDMITQLDAQRSATQTKATSNTANSIIKTEDALKNMQSEMDAMGGQVTGQQKKVFDALTQRLEFMKQNSKAVIEADDIKYQTRFKKIKQENELADQQKQAVQRRLSSVPFESDQYKELAQEARNANQGQAVDQYEKLQFGLIEARAKADDIRDSEKPLSQSEIETLAEIGIIVPKNQTRLSIKSNRQSLANYTQAVEVERIRSAISPIAGVKDVEAHVITTLETLMDFGDLPGNFLSSDLYNKIEDLLEDPDEIKTLVGLLEMPSGKELNSGQIRERVEQYIANKFPDEYKEAKTYRQTQAREQADIDLLVVDLLVEAGVATRNEDGSVDLAGVDEKEIRRARREVDRRRSLIGILTSDNIGRRAQERKAEVQENVAGAMGRGI